MSLRIKRLHAEMDKRKINYISLGPSNKAARIANGITIHKWIASFNMQSFIDTHTILFLLMNAQWSKT